MFHVLGGNRNKESGLEYARRIANTRVPMYRVPPGVVSGVPTHVIDVIEQCLFSDPQKRPKAQQLFDAFESWR
jgi:hypothetical protein